MSYTLFCLKRNKKFEKKEKFNAFQFSSLKLKIYFFKRSRLKHNMGVRWTFAIIWKEFNVLFGLFMSYDVIAFGMT